MSYLFLPIIIILMYFVVSFGHVIFEFWEFSHKMLSFSVLIISFMELFWSIFEFNCCGCTVVCELNEYRLSIAHVEHWMGRSMSIKKGKELEVCDCSHVLDLCISQVNYIKQQVQPQHQGAVQSLLIWLELVSYAWTISWLDTTLHISCSIIQ